MQEIHATKFRNSNQTTSSLSIVDLNSVEPSISDNGEELTFEEVPEGDKVERIFDFSESEQNYIHQIDYFTEND